MLARMATFLFIIIAVTNILPSPLPMVLLPLAVQKPLIDLDEAFLLPHQVLQ